MSEARADDAKTFEAAGTVRRSAGIFRPSDRALLEVRGSDRIRFLQGQLSNDVEALDPGGPNAGCHALLLTREGRIVADLHVVARPGCLWLETARSTAEAARERLAKYVVADDVEIEDRSGAHVRLAVEGPRAAALLTAASGQDVELGPEQVATLPIGGSPVVVAAWGWSGEPAYQLIADAAAGEAVETALGDVAATLDAIRADAAVLEVLRIEAGTPMPGNELDESTLPAEARLVESAVSFTKGCYTGQEIVARMQSRGRVGHLLVGLVLEGGQLPAPGAVIEAEGRRVGAVTSATHSPLAGAIALGFVRAGHDEPGMRLEAGGLAAHVVRLPFVASGAT